MGARRSHEQETWKQILFNQIEHLLMLNEQQVLATIKLGR
jgi:hypothetical protein